MKRSLSSGWSATESRWFSHDIRLLTLLIMVMAEPTEKRLVTADDEAFRFQKVVLWRRGKAADGQLTDSTQATLDVGKRGGQKSTPAIAASGYV